MPQRAREGSGVTPGYLPFHPSPKKPSLALPPGSCDTHCHVFGPAARFPFAPGRTYTPVDAPKEVLFQRHRFLGIERAVIVQASCHGTDNEAMLDALRARPDTCRGVALVAEGVTPAELERLHAGGVRGVRFNFLKRLGGGRPLETYRPVIEKVAPLGWHVVVYFDGPELETLEPFLRSIPTPVIIDHMGRAAVEQGVEHPAFRRLCALLEKEPRFHIKVTGPERLSQAGPPYLDVDPFARRLVEAVPEQVLWGTDWPHPNMKSHMPDDGVLVERIGRILDTPALQRRVLVENPTRLYWQP